MSLLAGAVLIGWHVRADSLAQVLPGLGPVHYNTALGLLALNGAALGMLCGSRSLMILGGLLSVLLGIAAVAEIFVPVSLGLEAIPLVPAGWSAGSQLGRLTLPTALSFLLSGTAMLWFALRRSYAALGILNSVTLGFALMSLFGSVFSATYLASYSDGTSMGILPAYAFLVYSGALLGYAWTREDIEIEGFPTWAAGLTFSIAPALFYAAETLIPERIESANFVALVIALVLSAAIAFAIRKLMTVSVSTKGLLIVAIPSVLLLAFAGLIANIDQRRELDEARAIHAAITSETSERLLTTITQSESAVRSFMLTRDQASIQTYPALLEMSDELGEQMEQLVINDSIEEERAKTIRTLTSERMAALSKVIATVQSKNPASIAWVIHERAGPERAELILALEAFSKDEQALGAERDSELQNSWRQTNKLLVAGATGGLLLASLMAAAFSGAMTRRINIIQDNVQRLRDGRRLTPRIKGADEIAHLDAGFHDLAHTLDVVHQSEIILNQQAQVRTSELQRFRSAMDASAEAIFLTDRASGLFVEANATAYVMTGYSHDELLCMGIGGLTENNELEDLEKRLSTAAALDGIELRIRRKDGTLLDVELHIVVAYVDDVWIEVTVARNITERKDSQRTLAKFAHYDALTNLPNRVLFYESLERTLLQAAQSDLHVVVMSIDIDQFKVVNDSKGHAVGDQLLRKFADRLLSTIRIRDIVARLGSDELAAVLVMDAESSAPTIFANKILDAIRMPFEVDGQAILVTASIGLSIFPDDATEPEEMVRQAQAAMYGAKQAGRDTFQFYTAQKNLDALARADLLASLKSAVANKEFVLYYQPKIRIHGNQIAGVEALLRWNRPVFGLVSPGLFIPALEESGLIVEVGRWVILEACRQIEAWSHSSVGLLQVAVNVSGRQFLDGDLISDVMAALSESNISPSLLELELTESSLMANTERTIATLHALKNLGLGISIDDFGTGFSSLAYLRRFPIDRLKIDIAFVREITTNSDDAAIAIAIIRMAHSLNLDVVAEGVETEAQLAYLRRHLCDYFQGYHFSRPLPVADFEALFVSHLRKSADEVKPRVRDTILVVDDDASVRASVGYILEAEGYAVQRASSAAEGFELLAVHDIQVILCDQRMPGTTGVEFFDRVKDLHPDTFRIILSGYTDPASILDSINRGSVYRFHTKPINVELLLSDLKVAFRHYRRLREEKALTPQL